MPIPRVLLPSTARRGLARAVALGTAAAVLVVVQAGLLAWVIDAAFLGGDSLSSLALPIGAIAVVAAARALLTWLGELAAARASARARHAIRSSLVEHIQAAGPAFVNGRPAGVLSAVVVNGVEAGDAFIAQYVPQLALAVLVPMLVGATVTAQDPLSGLVLWLTYPLIPTFMFLIGGHARAATERQWTTLVRLRARVLDAIQGLSTLKAFGAVSREAAVVRQAGETFRAVTMRVLRVAFVSALVLELLATLGVAIVAVEVGLRLLYGHIEFRPALFVLVLAPEFYRPLRALGAAFHAGMSGQEAARSIAALQRDATDAAIADPASAPLPSGTRVIDAPGGLSSLPAGPPAIRFESVTYTYPGRTTRALDQVTLEIAAGETTALVGESGAGKTTVAHILLRLLEPQGGSVRVGAGRLSSTDPAAWHRQVAWVPQRPYLFHGSVRDNLLVARPRATDREIARAITLAQAEELVRLLPQGLDTPVGERGERLSGGEAQRLALARAFLKDAPVLVLDEPTAQLDPETDAALSTSLRELRHGRTVLLIAHRLTTVRDTSSIVVLEQGRVRECGTHERLLRAGGAYARLVDAYEGTL